VRPLRVRTIVVAVVVGGPGPGTLAAPAVATAIIVRRGNRPVKRRGGPAAAGRPAQSRRPSRPDQGALRFTLLITTGVVGTSSNSVSLSCPLRAPEASARPVPVGMRAILSTTSMPPTTLPKTA